MVIPQLPGQPDHRVGCLPQWLQVEHLRTDVHMEPDKRQLRPRGGVTRDCPCASMGTPNLWMLRPVAMCGWLSAATSGLIRSATRAVVCRARAAAAIRSSSPADSALIALTPRPTAWSISATVFPTPVKTISPGAYPARSATSISPPELASTSPPAALTTRTTARFELAFSA